MLISVNPYAAIENNHHGVQKITHSGYNWVLKNILFFEWINSFVWLKVDAPRKRIDKFKNSNGPYSQLAVGSPVVGRRGIIVSHGPRHQSCHTTPLQSPCTSPIVTSKDGFLRMNGSDLNHNTHGSDNDNASISSNTSTNINQQIRSRINSFKFSMFNTPKFYRRKILSYYFFFRFVH